MPNKGRGKNWTKAEKNTLKKYGIAALRQRIKKILNKSVWAIYARRRRYSPSKKVAPVEAKKLTWRRVFRQDQES